MNASDKAYGREATRSMRVRSRASEDARVEHRGGGRRADGNATDVSSVTVVGTSMKSRKMRPDWASESPRISSASCRYSAVAMTKRALAICHRPVVEQPAF